MTDSASVVLLDGLPVGNLDITGSLSVQVAQGSHAVTVLDPNGARGDIVFQTTGGAIQPVSVIVQESDAIFAPGTAQSAELSNGVFALGTGPVTISILDVSSQNVTVSTIKSAYLRSSFGTFADVASLSQISTGGNVIIDLQTALANFGADPATIASNGPFFLDVEVENPAGAPYLIHFVFEIGFHSVSGLLSAPPSNPSLPTASVPILFKKHVSEITYQVTSGLDGSFSLAGIPSGQYAITASIEAGGITYNVFGTSDIESGVNLAVTPLAPIDLANGVVSIETTVVPGSPINTPRQLRFTLPNRTTPKVRQFPKLASSIIAISTAAAPTVPPTGPFGDAITVTAGAQGQPINKQAVFNIPTGTQSVSVFFETCSDEYPDFVRAQSQFNDLWSVFALDASGKKVVFEDHNVNEQLTVEPTWEGDGCTGVIETPVDVSAASANGSVSITLAISATNVGDSILPTTVQAIVALPTNFSISSFSVVKPVFQCVVTNSLDNIRICDPQNQGNYISIPPAGASNLFPREANVTLDFPPSNPVTITNVRLDITDVNGTVLDTVFDGPPGTDVISPSGLQFSLTYDGVSPGGTLLASHPEQVSYVVTVDGTQGGVSVTAQDTSTQFNTLWSAVAGGVQTPRYGQPPDPGGDDWAIQKTIDWMVANPQLLTRFNDISGEHGRNLGHTTHGIGTDIDIFHFATLNAVSGTANYEALRNAAAGAAQNTPGNKTTVANFITQNRAGIDALNADPIVEGTLFGIGSEFPDHKIAKPVLATGWLQQAMLNGTLKLANGTNLDLGVGPWSPSTTPIFNVQHNNHVHVTLAF